MPTWPPDPQRADLLRALSAGRRGRVLALALALMGAYLLWAGAGAPLTGWYAARAAALADRAELAARLAALAAALPALREAAQTSDGTPPRAVFLPGNSDALAGARLQELVGTMAGAAGLVPASLETLPAEPRGALRRIGLRVTLAAPWPRLVGLLVALARAEPPMLLDELTLRGLPARGRADDATVAASFAVYAFRAGGI